MDNTFTRQLHSIVQQKNIPNDQVQDGSYVFMDYVWKDPEMSGGIPTDATKEEIKEIADEEFEVYKPLNDVDEITVTFDEDRGSHLAIVEVDVPYDGDRQMELANLVGEKLVERRH